VVLVLVLEDQEAVEELEALVAAVLVELAEPAGQALVVVEQALEVVVLAVPAASSHHH